MSQSLIYRRLTYRRPTYSECRLAHHQAVKGDSEDS